MKVKYRNIACCPFAIMFFSGKVGCKAVTGKHRFLVGKKARRLQAKQIRENKRAVLSENYVFSNNYLHQPPIFVVSFLHRID